MTRGRSTWSLVLAAAALLGSTGAGAAPDVNAGRRLALQWCSTCHVVADPQPRPAVDGVPSFMALGNDPRMTVARLSSFLQAPHPVMPDLSLSRREIENIAGYIQSLKRK